MLSDSDLRTIAETETKVLRAELEPLRAAYQELLAANKRLLAALHAPAVPVARLRALEYIEHESMEGDEIEVVYRTPRPRRGDEPYIHQAVRADSRRH
jgi:hypothetical protein